MDLPCPQCIKKIYQLIKYPFAGASLLPKISLQFTNYSLLFQTDSLTQKGEQMNIRNLRVDDPMFQQCLYVYDVVYLNGKVLTNKPLRERIEIVKECIKEERGRVQLVVLQKKYVLHDLHISFVSRPTARLARPHRTWLTP